MMYVAIVVVALLVIFSLPRKVRKETRIERQHMRKKFREKHHRLDSVPVRPPRQQRRAKQSVTLPAGKVLKDDDYEELQQMFSEEGVRPEDYN